ncbi:hypothetical protein KF913_04900 [Candidatus Obscuribacterales bacterium]|nr:hypothetical protein [Candidatus Obscuribacterales bacterium]
MILRKKQLTLAIAAIGCCLVLFMFGLGFGLKDPPNKGPLINERIRVIAPKFGHAPVRAETVATAKDVLEKLPPKVYNLLEEGGASINLAPNIEDNWPGSGDGLRPGDLDMTMGEEGGRCYGRDVWVYEAKKVRGSEELKRPRSQETIRGTLCQILGHAINDCMGVMTKNDELTRLYNEDLDNIPASKEDEYVEELNRNHDTRALGCSSIIGVLIGGPDWHDGLLKDFPRTTAYLKKRLEIR